MDIDVLLATGDRHRERRKLNAGYSKTTAGEWGERRERELLLSGPKIKKEWRPKFDPAVASDPRDRLTKARGVHSTRTIKLLEQRPRFRAVETIWRRQRGSKAKSSERTN